MGDVGARARYRPENVNHLGLLYGDSVPCIEENVRLLVARLHQIPDIEGEGVLFYHDARPWRSAADYRIGTRASLSASDNRIPRRDVGEAPSLGKDFEQPGGAENRIG